MKSTPNNPTQKKKEEECIHGGMFHMILLFS